MVWIRLWASHMPEYKLWFAGTSGQLALFTTAFVPVDSTTTDKYMQENTASRLNEYILFPCSYLLDSAL